MCFFYTEYTNVTIDTRNIYTLKSISGGNTVFTLYSRDLCSCVTAKKNVPFIFYIKRYRFYAVSNGYTKHQLIEARYSDGA